MTKNDPISVVPTAHHGERDHRREHTGLATLVHLQVHVDGARTRLARGVTRNTAQRGIERESLRECVSGGEGERGGGGGGQPLDETIVDNHAVGEVLVHPAGGDGLGVGEGIAQRAEEARVRDRGVHCR